MSPFHLPLHRVTFLKQCPPSAKSTLSPCACSTKLTCRCRSPPPPLPRFLFQTVRPLISLFTRIIIRQLPSPPPTACKTSCRSLATLHMPHHVFPVVHPPQSADRAHDSRQHELLSQLSHSFTAIASSLSDVQLASCAHAPPPPPSPPLRDMQRVCELEQEVEQLKSAIASQALLSSLTNSIGSTAASSAGSDIPQMQVCSIVWGGVRVLVVFSR